MQELQQPARRRLLMAGTAAATSASAFDPRADTRATHAASNSEGLPLQVFDPIRAGVAGDTATLQNRVNADLLALLRG